MHKDIYADYQKYVTRNWRRSILKKIVRCLACVVVFFTTYALILPAITIENQAFCGLEEHIHSDACYQQISQRNLVCTTEVLGIHSHGPECFGEEGTVICGQADYLVHSHDESCVDSDGMLICTLPERSAHVHGSSCYAPEETVPVVLHVHSEECNVPERGELICGLEEQEGHAHGTDCYHPGETLLCTTPEYHVHDDTCREYPLLCTQSTDAHFHSDGCYAPGTELLCTVAEGHVHDESCVQTSQVCGMTEQQVTIEPTETFDAEENNGAEEAPVPIVEDHIHTEACSVTTTVCTVPENHYHEGSCYATVINCGMEDGQILHVHDKACYSTEPQLICTVPENHAHTESCYQPELHCQLEEFSGHSHTDECYQWNSVIGCGLEEGQPEPTEPPVPTEPVLICTEPAAQVHIHGDSCFEMVILEQTPLCGNTAEDHVHSHACYLLDCGMEPHTHDLPCYSDSNADLESAATWESTFAHVNLTGDPATDLVAIAQTQIGYTESSRNYAVWEDNSIHGYTRYGAWYGSPHGDWCAMFVSFCLHYADVEGMPQHWGVRPWIDQLTGLGLYHSAADYSPKPGDLIFYDWEGDGLSDHVGIVAEVTEAGEHTGAGIMAIEGNSSNCVRYVSYNAADPVILGYSELPAKVEAPAVIEKTAVIYTDFSCQTVAEETMQIVLSGSIPEEAVVRAYPVMPETRMEMICAYDISILLPDGTVFEPAEGEKVTVCLRSSDFLQISPEAKVFYIPAEGSPVPMETSIAEDTVSFEAGHFSVYAVAVPVSPTTKTALIYTDSSYLTPAEDETVITLSGTIPEEAEVRAYPTTVEAELDVLCAYDITIFLPDGSIYEPGEGEAVNVSIQSPVLEAAASDFSVYHIPEEGTPDPVEAEVAEGIVSFETDHFSVYAIARSDGPKADVHIDPELAYTEASYSRLGYETFFAISVNLGNSYPSSTTITITALDGTDLTNAVVFRKSSYEDSQISSVNTANSVQFTETDAWRFNQYIYAVLIPPESIGSLVLSEDMIVSEKMYIAEDTTIDLNGYTMRPADGYTDALFEVMEGGSLTIRDSQAEQGSGHSLTYSVMYSSVSNSSIGQTNESTTEYTVSASGGIEAGAGPVIQVNGGTVIIESGMIHGGTGRAIVASGNSTVNLNGGYIYDFGGVGEGGAIYINGGTLNVSGTVVAQNYATNYGGGIHASNCEVSMSGGVITGNTVASASDDNGYSGSGADNARFGGGGIAAYSCTIHLTGGYVTCNASLADGYWGGGGGILCRDRTTLNMSGGYVTGNIANSGGGIKTIDYVDGSATINISGGYICSNLATYGEGGGMAIGGGDSAYVTAAYINNNATNCPNDWGGGGIFVANDASMYIEKALVTENSSGGFGGGIAGCSTARMYISITGGGAIYNNGAAGQNMAGGGSTKSEDVAYAKNSPVFMSNGYQDIFSALNCSVEGGMLGGAPALWTGSCDGEPVNSSSSDDLIHSENVLGLTARADADAAALSIATVFITGNSSNTHGGGILCNGYLVMGSPRESIMYVGARLEVSAEKTYLDQNGEPMEMPASSPFTFEIVKEDGTLVTTGTAKTNGLITFDGRIPFSDVGNYTYLIREVPGSDPTILYDQTCYRLRVATSFGSINNPASNVETRQCYIDSIAVDKWNPDTEGWETYIESYDPADTDKGAIRLDLGDSFVNYGGNIQRDTSLTVTKLWNCDDSFIPESITVTLMQNGSAYSPETATVELSSDNQWTYTWVQLPVADQEGNAYTYTVQETALENFDVTYSVEVDPVDATLKATITNTLKTYALDVSKLSNHSEPVPLEGAVFHLKNGSGRLLSFVLDPETGMYIPATEANRETVPEAETVTDLITNAYGKLLISGLPAGTYTLEETQAPFGFLLADPVTVHLGGQIMETQRVHMLTVVDRLIEYALPETGGTGTIPYTAAGSILMLFSAAYLLYNTRKRRREVS